MLLSPEQQSKIAQIRAKTSAGTATAADFKEVYAILRAGRMSTASTAKPGKTKKAPVNADNLFAELDNL